MNTITKLMEFCKTGCLPSPTKEWLTFGILQKLKSCLSTNWTKSEWKMHLICKMLHKAMRNN